LSTEDNDVKALLIKDINLLFKTRRKPQIASDHIRKQHYVNITKYRYMKFSSCADNAEERHGQAE
jgi:hypothetical protein